MNKIEPAPAMAPGLLSEHRERRALLREMHSRPFPRQSVPGRILHLAFRGGRDSDKPQRRERLQGLLSLLLSAAACPRAEDIGDSYQMQVEGLGLRWENHTEYASYSLSLPLTREPAGPRPRPVLPDLPAKLYAGLPDGLIAGFDLVILDEPLGDDDLFGWLGGHGAHDIMASRVLGGVGTVYTAMVANPEGMVPVLFVPETGDEAEIGRAALMILEVLTYHMLALLGLPVARRMGAVLVEVDRNVARLAAEMAEAPEDDDDAREAGGGEGALLQRITELANRLEQSIAESAYRLGASRAYHGIVTSRLTELGETPVGKYQTLGAFLARRLIPAMDTCRSVEDRQYRLSQRATRLGALLRARVEVALQEQNRDLLKSMDRRARQQLRLQQTVEGVSVVAISYYLVSLINYLLKGFETAGTLPNADIITGGVVPVAVALVAGGLFYLRQRLTRPRRGK